MLLPYSYELNFTKFPCLLGNYQTTLHENLLLRSRTDSCVPVVCMCSVRTGWNECTLWKSFLLLSLPFCVCVCVCVCVCAFFFRDRKISMKSSKVTSVLNLLSEFNFGLFRSYTGDRGGTVVKVLCYKLEGRWFDSRWCHWNFSLT